MAIIGCLLIGAGIIKNNTSLTIVGIICIALELVHEGIIK